MSRRWRRSAGKSRLRSRPVNGQLSEASPDSAVHHSFSAGSVYFTFAAGAVWNGAPGATRISGVFSVNCVVRVGSLS